VEEPWRALYHTRDLHDRGDEQWLSPYPDPTNWSEHHVLIDRARTYGRAPT
jgi:2-oxoisovalerate dehydrogenase E1 component